jgi:ribonuclease HII
MARACHRLSPRPDLVVVDGNRPLPTALPQRTLVRGDRRCASVAAASILAKVYRDHLMDLLDAKYPGYGFGRHKGYGAAAHLAALRERGPTPAHRRSFRPLASWLAAGSSLFPE